MSKPAFIPEHGGNIEAASRYFDIPIECWLDLSTGVNPNSYHIPDIPASAYCSMPYQQASFIQAVARYYENDQFVALNGTQQAITILPSVLDHLPVLLPEVGYQEHHRAWLRNGNEIVEYPAFNHATAVEFISHAIARNPAQHIVVINPNNPSGLSFSPDTLRSWASALQSGATLIVDEAFIDCGPSKSVLPSHMHANMVVLRSFGKFFGLAGIRLGFCFAAESVLQSLSSMVNSWDVNGPAQVIATQAFQDQLWIDALRAQSAINIEQRQQLFAGLFDHLPVQYQTHQALFSSYVLPHNAAMAVYEGFAYLGILLRLIPHSDQYTILRIGQCDLAFNNNLERINQACAEVKKSLFKTFCMG